jgi:hypothetical protein
MRRWKEDNKASIIMSVQAITMAISTNGQVYLFSHIPLNTELQI